AAPAPGADDNGSGAAGLLEIARVLAEVRTRHDLRLILFGGEEEGLFGSIRYVTSLDPGERLNIAAVVNMDMIASLNTPEPTVLLEGAEISQGLIDELATAAATYTPLKVQTSLRPFNSDHVPFIDASIPAVLTIEGADSANQNVHTAGDTLDTVDQELARGIVRMNVATAATALLADA
ncbi:MAG: M28 family metallopeptidase, partial [Spirillospora sp.]